MNTINKSLIIISIIGLFVSCAKENILEPSIEHLGQIDYSEMPDWILGTWNSANNLSLEFNNGENVIYNTSSNTIVFDKYSYEDNFFIINVLANNEKKYTFTVDAPPNILYKYSFIRKNSVLMNLWYSSNSKTTLLQFTK